MSQFIGQAGGDTAVVGVDQRILSIYFQTNRWTEFGDSPQEPALGSYTTPWWPGTGGVTGAQVSDQGILGPSDWYCPPDITRGATALYGIVGVTRDANGSPLLGCTVNLYLTATNALVSTTVSDPNNGSFTAPTPYYGQNHYLVAYLAGSPDRSGTSVNTLQPS